MPEAIDAVLLLGFGGPARSEDVRPFIENVIRGRRVAQDRVETVVDQYRQIGGKSPFLELTLAQASALEAELKDRGHKIGVYIGTLYWHPFVLEALKQIIADGAHRILAILLPPQRSQASYDRYLAAVKEAQQQTGTKLSIEFAPQWHDHPLFIEAIAERMRPALAQATGKTRVLFTAHSIPRQMPDAALYAEQVLRVSTLASQRLKLLDWRVAYQSRSGPFDQPWLEPDVREAIVEAGKDDVQTVVVVPVGFVCDNVEVLYDLDLQAQATARASGLAMLRVATVGTHPLFIKMLANFVLAKACTSSASNGV